MILYNEKNGEKLLFVKCDCGTHGIELSKLADMDENYPQEIYLSIYTNNFSWKQYGFFKRTKMKLKKIWYIIIGKDYKIDDEICLNQDDIDCLIKGLEEIKK